MPRSSTEVLHQPSFTTTSDALPSFVSPLGLLWNDATLFFKIWTTIPGIILPLRPCLGGEVDELSFTAGNLSCITVHGVLIVLQFIFLASLPLCFMLPLSMFLFYFIGFLIVNYILFIPINGQRGIVFEASPERGISVLGKGEKWIFINGVAAGHHWMQNNIQRLANTFRRQIIAVHNPTYGIIFDIIQCLIERDFSYNTADVRQAYALVKDELMKSSNNKVVLIVHSQGGIEGGMIIDWLLSDLPEQKLSKLEVYTFGNAANHSNNPVRRSADNINEPEDYYRAIPYIEHYANSGDFVSRFGVLNYARKGKDQKENKFAGRVFERTGSGHMFCQHYLDTMFVMEAGRVAEHNLFMDSIARVNSHNSDYEYLQKNEGRTVRSMSRLWEYRNGEAPSK
ncbi:hypothetical protein V500_06092 [Pseudogymnoascus sp. VKM F-4518 (FW-2643)]|nr:hypothetical protein V500_06092 [Pseudogymnoascus sp. VKM F-4518 (FW-2643)]